MINLVLMMWNVRKEGRKEVHMPCCCDLHQTEAQNGKELMIQTWIKKQGAWISDEIVVESVLSNERSCM